MYLVILNRQAIAMRRRGKGLFFPRIPEVTSAHIRTMTENGGGGQSNRGRGTATDFDIDP